MILQITEHPTSATDFYRGAGIAKNLSKNGVEIVSHLEASKFIHWYQIMEFDVLYFLRPTGALSLKIFTKAMQLGVKTWIDYDDLLYEVPPGNPAQSQYEDQNLKNRLTTMLKLADVVTVSTKALAENLGRYVNRDYVVIKNAINPDIVREFAGQREFIYWRGTHSHIPDIHSFEDQIREGMRSSKVPYLFHGLDYYSLSYEPNYNHRKMEELQDYFSFISLTPPIGSFIPLMNCAFNRCKSEIAALEALIVGARVLVPNFWYFEGYAEYYGNNFEFMEGLQSLQIPKTQKEREEGREYVLDSFNLEKENNKRFDIISNL